MYCIGRGLSIGIERRLLSQYCCCFCLENSSGKKYGNSFSTQELKRYFSGIVKSSKGCGMC